MSLLRALLDLWNEDLVIDTTLRVIEGGYSILDHELHDPECLGASLDLAFVDQPLEGSGQEYSTQHRSRPAEVILFVKNPFISRLNQAALMLRCAKRLAAAKAGDGIPLPEGATSL